MRSIQRALMSELMTWYHPAYAKPLTLTIWMPELP